jgi:hypothetical protein
VRAASVAELAAIPKITPKLAQRIHDFFHPQAPPFPPSGAAPADAPAPATPADHSSVAGRGG